MAEQARIPIIIPPKSAEKIRAEDLRRFLAERGLYMEYDPSARSVFVLSNGR